MREINDRWFVVPTSIAERHRAFASAISAGSAKGPVPGKREPLTVLVVAPQGAGKSRNAAFLCQALGCDGVLDDLDTVAWPEEAKPGTLVLSQDIPAGVPDTVLVMSLEQAIVCALKLDAKA